MNKFVEFCRLVHSEDFSYSCPLCPYKGKRQIYLTLHMRTHTGEHPYLCSECPAKFVNSSNLRKHELVHANKKFEVSMMESLIIIEKKIYILIIFLFCSAINVKRNFAFKRPYKNIMTQPI